MLSLKPLNPPPPKVDHLFLIKPSLQKNLQILSSAKLLKCIYLPPLARRAGVETMTSLLSHCVRCVALFYLTCKRKDASVSPLDLWWCFKRKNSSGCKNVFMYHYSKKNSRKRDVCDCGIGFFISRNLKNNPSTFNLNH